MNKNWTVITTMLIEEKAPFISTTHHGEFAIIIMFITILQSYLKLALRTFKGTNVLNISIPTTELAGLVFNAISHVV